MRRVPIVFPILVVCLACLSPASAQQPVDTAAALSPIGSLPPAGPETIVRGEDGRVTMRATRLAGPLAVDGSLDEEVYGTVPAARNFVQQYPTSGQPASEDTDVWVFFDDRNIYVSARCWDSRPGLMVADEMRRDNRNIWANDNVTVVLDTFYDHRTAFFFQTNPVGGVRDALVVDEGTVNYDWNTVWDVRTRRFDKGWTVEMAIPFKSLRYKPVPTQVWGINVNRVVKSKNEMSLLAPAPLNYGGTGLLRLASAATLVGIEAPRGAANFELKPYAISSLATNRPAQVSNEVDGAVGIDAKYGITSSLTADVTANTDFAQVEIDEQQVNLTRFSLFFPEKRDFFLEGQGLFEFAGSSSRGSNDDTPVLFYTRRIGLSAGQPVPIDVGGRLMGRVGRTSLGLLNIRTADAPSAGAAATDFSVARVKRDILRNSNVGLMVTNRSPALPGVGSNQVYGADANLQLSENLKVGGYYARSATPGQQGDVESYLGQFRYNADRYGFNVERTKVGDGFNPEVGFLRRTDFVKTFATARFSPRIRRVRGVRQLKWEVAGNQYVNHADVVESTRRRGTFQIDFNSSDSFKLEYHHTYELVFAPFQVDGGLTVPTGAHRYHEMGASYTLGSQRRLSGELSVDRNGFYSHGHQTQVGYTGRAIFSPRLAVEPRLAVTWLEMPQGSARIALFGARPIVTVSPRMYFSALVQYNSSSHALETNARWRWEYQPGSDLFLVYTDGRDTARSGFPTLVNRGLAVKLTRLLRF